MDRKRKVELFEQDPTGVSLWGGNDPGRGEAVRGASADCATDAAEISTGSMRMPMLPFSGRG